MTQKKSKAKPKKKVQVKPKSNIETRVKKIFPGYLVLQKVTKEKKEYYNIERIRKQGKSITAIPATFEPLSEWELNRILSAIEKKDRGALSSFMGKIRKKGMFYRMIEPAPPAKAPEKKAPEAPPVEKVPGEKVDTEKKIEESEKQDENNETESKKDDQKKDQEKK